MLRRQLLIDQSQGTEKPDREVSPNPRKLLSLREKRLTQELQVNRDFSPNYKKAASSELDSTQNLSPITMNGGGSPTRGKFF